MKDYTLEKRKYVIGMAAVVIVLIYVIRLFDLQIMTDDYKKNADSNAFLNKIQYPSRGAIYDRNGKLLVFNQPAYDITFVPREVTQLDTLDLCRALNITFEQFQKRMKDVKNRWMNPGYSKYNASGVYDATLGRRVRCVSGETIQVSRFLHPAAYYPAIYLRCCRTCVGGI